MRRMTRKRRIEDNMKKSEKIRTRRKRTMARVCMIYDDEKKKRNGRKMRKTKETKVN